MLEIKSMAKEMEIELVTLQKYILDYFTESDWLSIGHSNKCVEIIRNHPRLFRSLRYKDDDYGAKIYQVLNKLIGINPNIIYEFKKHLSERYDINFELNYISTASDGQSKSIFTYAPVVFKTPTKSQNNKLVSVMLPFDLNNTYEQIKSACKELKLECMKANDIWENSEIIDDIFELIFISKVVVADFTNKNPNVFYEVGIAHTLGKIVIPITQNINDIPFDLGHHRVLHYYPNLQGLDKLKNDIKLKLKKIFNITQLEDVDNEVDDEVPF